MATFTVTTKGDSVDASDGRLSLREAVERADARVGADRIEFAGAVEGGRLVLSRGDLVVDDDLAIDGSRSDAGKTTIDGNQESRILRLEGAGTSVGLSDLTITNGLTPLGENGGGILMDDGTSLSLTRSALRDNIAAGNYIEDGGGVFAGENTSITVIDSEISGNEGSEGGGIYAGSLSRLRISGSVFDANAAQVGGGGALYLRDGTVSIVSSTISNNYGRYDGGGIQSYRGRIDVINSTLAGNTVGGSFGVGDGAAISAGYRGEVSFESTTITGNAVAADYYGGDYLRASGVAAGLVRVANSIVAGNFDGLPGEPGTSPDEIDTARLISNGHNVFGAEVAGAVEGDVEGASLEAIFRSIDPETGGGRLELNGGRTPIVALAEKPSNPALSGADARTAPEVDQRGLVRPAPDDTNPDIGAYELRQSATPTEPTPFNDAIAGTGARDVIRAEAGNDLVQGARGGDQVLGETGSDTLYGGRGDDHVIGGAGSDLISGGPNVDQLTGGTGRDGFDLDQGHTGVGAGNRDRLLDFDRADDLIDLAGVDARSGTGGDQAFAFIGTRAFSGPGQLRYSSSGPDTLIQGSTDGDRSAELELQVTGRLALGADDFVL